MLGPVLAGYREAARFGVRAMASQIGISPATLNRIENGHACDSDTLAAILLWMIGPHPVRAKRDAKAGARR